MIAFLCTFSGLASLATLSAAFLASIVLWRGGSIEKIKFPHLFEVILQRPVVFKGSALWLLPGGIALIVILFSTVGAGSLRLCQSDDVWVFVGTWTDATWSDEYFDLPKIDHKNQLVGQRITASNQIATSVQLYAEADFASPVIDSLAIGETVEVIETLRLDNAEFWAKIKLK